MRDETDQKGLRNPGDKNNQDVRMESHAESLLGGEFCATEKMFLPWCFVSEPQEGRKSFQQLPTDAKGGRGLPPGSRGSSRECPRKPLWVRDKAA